MTESQILDEVRLIFGADPRCVLWRNNVGQAEFRGRTVRYGLAVGSADLIGLFKGIFLSIEIKRPGAKQTPEQKLFEALVIRKGGVYRVVTSADDAYALLTELEAMTR